MTTSQEKKPFNNAMAIKKIKTLQRLAGVNNESHIANVQQITDGRASSCTLMSKSELLKLTELYIGFAKSGNDNPQQQLTSQQKCIYALWTALYLSGHVDTDTKAACDKWFMGRFKTTIRHAVSSKLSQAIDSMKSWQQRPINERGDL